MDHPNLGTTVWVRCAAAFAAAWFACTASATDVSGDQTGLWTLADSPYHLVGDVRVPPGESLTIEPGVEVVAQGHFVLEVDQALLTAAGNASQPILMTAADPVTGWRGLRLLQADDTSVIDHCILEYAHGSGAYPDVRGGALFLDSCSPTVTHSTFRYSSSHNGNQNGAGGGICTQDSSAVIRDNLIHDNTADSGGGICVIEYGTPLIEGNRVLDNQAINGGGGMYLGARSTPEVRDNVILRNQSTGWGGGGIASWTGYVFYLTSPTIEDNLVAHNAATDGGGLYLRYDRAAVTNNTVVFNAATGTGGGIYTVNQTGSQPWIGNCVVWGNVASAGAAAYADPATGSLIEVAYSDVEGGWLGTGNVDLDPLFADPAGADGVAGTDDDDFRLTASSPCIDAGNSTLLSPVLTQDLDGNPRYVDDPATPDTGYGPGAPLDLGAWEFQPEGLGDDDTADDDTADDDSEDDDSTDDDDSEDDDSTDDDDEDDDSGDDDSGDDDSGDDDSTDDDSTDDDSTDDDSEGGDDSADGACRCHLRGSLSTTHALPALALPGLLLWRRRSPRR